MAEEILSLDMFLWAHLLYFMLKVNRSVSKYESTLPNLIRLTHDITDCRNDLELFWSNIALKYLVRWFFKHLLYFMAEDYLFSYF